MLGGAVENYRSNLLLSMIASGNHASSFANDGTKPAGWMPALTEQQMIMRELCAGTADTEIEVQALAGQSKRWLNPRVALMVCRLPSSYHVLHFDSSGV